MMRTPIYKKLFKNLSGRVEPLAFDKNAERAIYQIIEKAVKRINMNPCERKYLDTPDLTNEFAKFLKESSAFRKSTLIREEDITYAKEKMCPCWPCDK